MDKALFCKCKAPYFNGIYFCINCLKTIHKLFYKRKEYKYKKDESSNFNSSMEET